MSLFSYFLYVLSYLDKTQYLIFKVRFVQWLMSFVKIGDLKS
jgi:hypothetical protein